MTYLSLSQWSSQFTPTVIRRIRRTIEGRLAGGETLIVLDGNAQGLTPEIKAEIRDGWPASKVRFSNAHPDAVRSSRERRRRLRS
jgi:hypothetical protein